MLINIMILTAITLIPAFELRASIPYGILQGSVSLPFHITVTGMGMHFFTVFIICAIANIFLGTLLYPCLTYIHRIFERIPIISKLWQRIIARSQSRLAPYVSKYGTIGIALFIAVPLPGSGSYSGALGAYILGLNYRQFFIANIIGVLIAAIAVTTITLSGQSLWQFIHP